MMTSYKRSTGVETLTGVVSLMGLNCHIRNLNVSNQDALFCFDHFAVGCTLGVLCFISEPSSNSRKKRRLSIQDTWNAVLRSYSMPNGAQLNLF